MGLCCEAIPISFGGRTPLVCIGEAPYVEKQAYFVWFFDEVCLWRAAGKEQQKIDKLKNLFSLPTLKAYSFYMQYKLLIFLLLN